MGFRTEVLRESSCFDSIVGGICRRLFPGWPVFPVVQHAPTAPNSHPTCWKPSGCSRGPTRGESGSPGGATRRRTVASRPGHPQQLSELHAELPLHPADQPELSELPLILSGRTVRSRNSGTRAGVIPGPGSVLTRPTWVGIETPQK